MGETENITPAELASAKICANPDYNPPIETIVQRLEVLEKRFNRLVDAIDKSKRVRDI